MSLAPQETRREIISTNKYRKASLINIWPCQKKEKDSVYQLSDPKMYMKNIEKNSK
jgi:hypothetical protein